MQSLSQARYLANLLTLQNPGNSANKLGCSVLNSTIDLTPHQIDAALFAFKNPLSKGVILADEVGLGKTIEAGLVISQMWAENKRRMLCITPASIRKQWQSELKEKFFIDSIILDSSTYRQLKNKCHNPLEQKDKVVICSYQYARTLAEKIKKIHWDLVIIDEAHRLRNVYRSDNRIARAIREAIQEAEKKLLLTATPLQNSLLELFGLVSFVDMRVFGGIDSFREQFIKNSPDYLLSHNGEDMSEVEAKERANIFFDDIKKRIAPIVHRTLRRQVRQYVKYTARQSDTIDFTPSQEEQELYKKVSDYLASDSIIGVSARTNHLFTLILRKILASSSFAISGTLAKLIERLKGIKENKEVNIDLAEDYESYASEEEDWKEAEDQSETKKNSKKNIKTNDLTDKIDLEIAQLEDYRKLSETITENAKGQALLQAIVKAFAKADELGSPHKILVFTESKRTQQYLKKLLEDNGYGGGKTILLNGTNNDDDSRRILKAWQSRHTKDGKATGIASADSRAAIIEEFRDNAEILIATESGAEGLNMQFCNIVVNYDLPWNPQRVEQRIGRCHRYGQKYDVVVFNFLNTTNAADKRVLELLRDKLNLFDGVFGSSDKVLGALESGVDIEKSILDILQRCRTEEEINKGFDDLQCQLKDKIKAASEQAKLKLFDNFDEDVQRRINGISIESLTQFESYLIAFLQSALGESFSYDEKAKTAEIKCTLPFWSKEWDGKYSIREGSSDIRQLHLNLPAVRELLSRAKKSESKTEKIIFDYSKSGKNVAMIKELVGQSGYLKVKKLTIKSLDTSEYLVYSIVKEDGSELSSEYAEKLLLMPVSDSVETDNYNGNISSKLDDIAAAKKQEIVSLIDKENGEFFTEEYDKLDKWAEDLKNNLEKEIKNLDREIRDIKKQIREESMLARKLELGKKQKDLESLRNKKRSKQYESQDKIDADRDTLLDNLSKRKQQNIEETELLSVAWQVI